MMPTDHTRTVPTVRSLVGLGARARRRAPAKPAQVHPVAKQTRLGGGVPSRTSFRFFVVKPRVRFVLCHTLQPSMQDACYALLSAAFSAPWCLVECGDSSHIGEETTLSGAEPCVAIRSVQVRVWGDAILSTVSPAAEGSKWMLT